jgi:PAS domain S-box-containing protein
MNDKIGERPRYIPTQGEAIRARLTASPIRSYGLAILSTLSASAVTFLLQPFVFRTPLLFLAIMFSAWIGGRGPGLLSLVIGTLSISLILNPDSIVPTRFNNAPNVGAFLLTGLLVCWWSLKRKQAEDALQKARIELEMRVLARTADLRQNNEQLQCEIVERKQAETALRDSEGKYRGVFETAHDMMVLLDKDGNILDINNRAEQVLGYSRSELLRMNTFQGLYLTEDRPLMRGVIDDLISGKVREYEVRWLKKDGKTVYFSGASAPRFATTGQFLSTVCALRDTTERKRTEQAVQKYLKRLETWHEIDEGILNARSLEAITEAVLNRVAALVPCQRAGVLLFDFEAQQAFVYAGRFKNESRFASTKPIAFSDLWKLNEKLDELRQGQVVVVDDMHSLPQYRGVQWTLEEGIQSEVIAPLLAHGELIGTFNVGADQLRSYGRDDVDIIRELANSLAIAIAQIRLFEEISAKNDRLRLLKQQLIEAQEMERRYIAQELHDQVSSNLTALSINLSIVNSQLPPELSEKLGHRLNDAQTLIETTVDRIRGMSADLSPLILEGYGLDATLRSYAQHFTERTGIAAEVQQKGAPVRLKSEEELALYRIVQEALTNVAKHAQASQVTIIQEMLEHTFRLVIMDNGIGFDPDNIQASAEQGTLGLLSIRDRAESIDGRLQIESSPGKGTRVIVELKR